MEYTHVVHHPGMTSSLLLAGFLPFLFNFPALLTDLYYLCLIPPAAYQCYRVVKDHMLPVVKGWFNQTK